MIISCYEYSLKKWGKKGNLIPVSQKDLNICLLISCCPNDSVPHQVWADNTFISVLALQYFELKQEYSWSQGGFSQLCMNQAASCVFHAASSVLACPVAKHNS